MSVHFKLNSYLCFVFSQITGDKPDISDRVGEPDDECMQGPDDWPTVEEERAACLNCFRAMHETVNCEYAKATLILESPLKQADQGFDCVEKSVYAEVKKSCDLDDDDLIEAYNELLTQEFNPDAEDFEEEHDDAILAQKEGKSDPYAALIVFTARASRT